MAKQSKLESEAIDKRHELEVISDYQKGTNEYNESHKDALSNGDPRGKGTGIAMGYSIPGQSTSKGINYSNVNTTDGGGQYDIEGRNGVGGRVYLENINLYNHENSYGVDSVDTSKNRAEGQFIVE
jgi:hypothetical protein